jgi:hypothetical protein
LIEGDTQILQHLIEIWEKELLDYISNLEDKIISRQLLPVRKVGADVGIDQVTTYDRTGAGAKIVAKGSRPKGSGSVATNVPYEIFQLLDGFKIHEKDIKLDPKLKSRDLKIILNNIHRAENYLAINGNTDHNISGIVTAAQANSNGVIATGDNGGAWDGSDSTRDIYNDILLGLTYVDPEHDPSFLLANKIDSRWLFAKDAEGVPFWKSVAALFGKKPTDDINSWLITTGSLTLAQNKVYLVTHDDEAAELVISENPTLRAISQQEGGNFPIEMFEWLTVEFHENDAFVEIDIT